MRCEIKSKQFVIDHEAMIVDGSSDLGACIPASRTASCSSTSLIFWRSSATICGRSRLTMRKTNLAWLLARRPDGIFVAPFDQGRKNGLLAKLLR
jgi:bifunctional non-homologous end joining protein LigD